ncbi:hypothetical protein FE773_00200 [Caminibacter mediatlanticus TB-2]|uniref:Uncharacterized protein n=1 Tax=Caminibacter mediatlanticus TB-2 TaxID=391592 RepID=A0ABX5V5W3_9BACT|nr:hypothetical protein [Caminibacter mediatlanticus]QCT93663.1 hypothetical protein FE773_00200 [Caminibacter mediatlanticus TB-2]
MKTILYTKDFDEQINEDVNIILSPHFYWVKKIEIPIKSIYTAKKIAKNLFDLDEKEYIFDAYKINKNYFAFAIKKNLEIQIPKKYIKGIYLAQIELFDFDCINTKKYSIQKVDGILFCFPKKEQNCNNIDDVIKNVKLKKRISLNSLSFDKTVLITLLLLFFSINIFYLIENIQLKKSIKNLEKQKENLIKTYNLPPTTFQLDSIYNELIDKYAKQKTIKKDLEFISNTPVKKFKKLLFDGKNYLILVETNKNLNNYFSKRFKILNYSLNPYKAKLTHE